MISTASYPASAMWRNASRTGRRNQGAVENTRLGVSLEPMGFIASRIRGDGERRGSFCHVSEEDQLPPWRGGRGTYEGLVLTLTDPGSRQGHLVRGTLPAPVRGDARRGV